MILEDLAPGARRRTHTAGTTEASLLGLLDVENHRLRVQNDSPKVNEAIEEGGGGQRDSQQQNISPLPAGGNGIFRERLLCSAYQGLGDRLESPLRKGYRLGGLSEKTQGLLHRRGQNHWRCP
jgi:hypothetical protein